jgi:hypothetical protein
MSFKEPDHNNWKIHDVYLKEPKQEVCVCVCVCVCVHRGTVGLRYKNLLLLLLLLYYIVRDVGEKPYRYNLLLFNAFPNIINLSYFLCVYTIQ